jgi:hypothetical protein
MLLIHISALTLALALNPWLLARHVARHAEWPFALALWGTACVALNTVAPLALHVGGIPVSASSLAAAHAGLAAFLLAMSIPRRLPLSPPAPFACAPLLAALAVLALLVLPVTHIAGIDTYKWQDLATAVQVEQCVPWLIHPLSLFGFTPRSYPSSQPLVLASIQLLGGMGVDWGFYVLSAVLGATGLFGAFALGRRLFGAGRPAFWFAALYLLSPVFMRYNYWATGRGLLMDLLPLFILALLGLPRVAAAVGTVVMAILLALAHKAGLVAAVVIPVLFGLAPLLRAILSRWPRTLVPSLIVLALAAGAVLGHGVPLNIAFRAGSRLGWLFPLALLGWVWPPVAGAWLAQPAWCAMFVAGVITLPMVFADDMYGALIALPFVTLAAVAGLQRLTAEAPPVRLRTTFATLGALTLATALLVVAHQAKDSPSEDAYRTALFLERHDPLGPYRIEAPGRLRTQMQAYCSGCPRFTIHPSADMRLATLPLPRRSGVWAEDFRQAIAWLRVSLSLSDVSTDWYGAGDRTYYVTSRGEGVVPPQAPLLTKIGDIALYGPLPP